MREIKFRARTIKGFWECGMLTYANFNSGVEKAIAVKTEFGSIFNERIDDSTIGQFTGLYDKNHTPIYEGDVLEIRKHSLFEEDNPETQVGDVFWYNGAFHIRDIYSSDGYNEIDNVLQELCCSDGTYDSWAECKIIGNIHDNPTFIKPTKE